MYSCTAIFIHGAENNSVIEMCGCAAVGSQQSLLQAFL